VLNLSGGNDALSMLIPYNDAQYHARRTVLAIPAAQVLQIGTDRGGNALGLNPHLTGLKTIFDAGRLALIQRTGYENSSRSHFQGTDIWSTANPAVSQGPGWVGRYLDTLPGPLDPLVGWSTTRDAPHVLQARTVGIASIRCRGGVRTVGCDPDFVARAGRHAPPGVRQCHGAAGVCHARPRL
jgi:uncharacterized protein (DUF1501 family)